MISKYIIIVVTTLYLQLQSAVNKEVLDIDDDVLVPANTEEMANDFNIFRKKRDMVSKKLGEKMLAGWALLADSCPECEGTPLMSKQGGPLHCVQCEKSFEKNKNGQIFPILTINNSKISKEVLQDSISKPVVKNINVEKLIYPKNITIDSTFQPIKDTPNISVATAPYLQPINITSKASQDTDTDISNLLSHKLMLGWTLLDESCLNSRCNGRVPLVRDKKGQVIVQILLI